VGSIAFYFIVKRVVDGDFVFTVVVDRIGQQLEANTMSGPVIASRVSPRGCDKEVGMDRLM
jgi:hypothetical protein